PLEGAVTERIGARPEQVSNGAADGRRHLPVVPMHGGVAGSRYVDRACQRPLDDGSERLDEVHHILASTGVEESRGAGTRAVHVEKVAYSAAVDCYAGSHRRVVDREGIPGEARGVDRQVGDVVESQR